MSWWSEKAWRIQRGVREDELKQRDNRDYDEQHVRQSIVHSREDVVMLVAYADAVNTQLSTIKWLLAATLALAAYAAFS